MLSHKAIPPRERLILALDVPTVRGAKELVETLGDACCFYKVGLELLMTGEYFELVRWLVERDVRVFADLKLFDVPNTVASAVRQLVGRGITFVTVHGNDGMIEAACAEKGDVKILAVTALTSLDKGDIEDLGFQVDVSALVLSRARRALSRAGVRRRHLIGSRGERDSKRLGRPTACRDAGDPTCRQRDRRPEAYRERRGGI
jgi:orotidine-5'-phosphate decarboxylase